MTDIEVNLVDSAPIKVTLNGFSNTSGDMLKSVYDPTLVEADAFSMGNMAETATEKILTDSERIKLTGIEALAEVNNVSDVNAADLTDSGDSTLHFHASDRDRANHTGTQLAATVSDFDTEVSNNTNVTANTTHRGLTNNPHSVVAAQVNLGNVTDDAQLKISSNLSDVANRQTSLDNLTDAISAVNEYVLTKDTVTGNAIFKVAPSGVSLWQRVGTTLSPVNAGDDTEVAFLNTTNDACLKNDGDTIIINQESLQSIGVGVSANASNASNRVLSFGYEAGLNNVGTGKVFIGAFAGRDNTALSNCTGIGFRALQDSSGASNIGIGSAVGRYVTGNSNILIGEGVAALSGINGSENVAIGTNSFKDANGSAGFNTAIGSDTLSNITVGDNNTSVGFAAGFSLTSPRYNTNIGSEAGYSNVTGEGQINLGNKSGYNETAANKLHVSNTDTWSLLEGLMDSSTGWLQVHGDIKTYNGTTSNTIYDRNGYQTPITSTDAAAPNNSTYYSSDASKLVYKDSGGVVNNLY